MKRIKLILTALMILTMCFAFAGCTDEESSSDSSKRETQTASFVVQLFPEYAPETVKNFKKLVKSGFYDGLTFHRVVEGFMAQGGDPNGDGTGGSSETVKGEFADNGYEKNTLSHTRGVVSMARSQDPDSASSQFFICYTDTNKSALDGLYAAFGKVNEEGMQTVDKFLTVERKTNAIGEIATPVTPIKIKSAKMINETSDGHEQVEFTVEF